MDNLTQMQIQAADAILNACTEEGTTTPSRIFGKLVTFEPDIEDITIAADFLRDQELIVIFETKTQNDYRLTPKGSKFKREGKTTTDLLTGMYEEEIKQIEKQSREDYKNELQIQDLEFRIKTVEEMQERQKVFWESGMDRDNRQKWQFWLTMILAAAGFLLGIINFAKDIFLRK
jgi:predicted transcriptional regulator